jgi:Family of unknown function (DUF6455)
MTDVMSRTGLSAAAALRRCNQPALITAAWECANCTRRGECEAWIADHADGATAAIPCFCPINNFLQSLDPRRPADLTSATGTMPGCETG